MAQSTLVVSIHVESNLAVFKCHRRGSEIGVCVDIDRFLLGDFEHTHFRADARLWRDNRPPCDDKRSSLRVVWRKILPIEAFFIGRHHTTICSARPREVRTVHGGDERIEAGGKKMFKRLV